MHRLAATPGGWNPDTEGVIIIQQTPAPIIFLSAADTDIQACAQALPQLPADFPAIRVTNLLQLQQQLTIDLYAEDVLEQAQVIILRLLGGISYWSYGFEVIQDLSIRTSAKILVLPGDDRPDPLLSSHSTVPAALVDQVWRYFCEGGSQNIAQAFCCIANDCCGTTYPLQPPQPVPRVGLYPWRKAGDQPSDPPTQRPQVGILFYRSHYVAGNTAVIDALCQAIDDGSLSGRPNLQPLPIFVSSLRDPEVQAEVLSWFKPQGEAGIQVLLNTTSFAIAKFDEPEATTSLWKTLDVPVLQVICSGSTQTQWQLGYQGLAPRDVAMNVALPEVDGRIISRVVSFKAVQTWNPQLETDVVQYEPLQNRIEFVADLAANWVKLRQTPVSERRIALILANYPTRDGRLANGVGLDTPASVIEILRSQAAAGYTLTDIPNTGDELIQWLTTGITNDPEGRELRPIQQWVTRAEFADYFQQLPAAVQTGICDRWSFSPGVSEDEAGADDFPVAGIQLGNIFIGIQPARGYDRDPALNYHAPDLEPTPEYLAFYFWLRSQFQAHAIVHVGKHGNLEWLPGKGIALSEDCYPEVALGPLPHLYPFIVNDPGEGTQAKRRSQAVIIDHLTPPMTRAELYGPLQQLESLIDEYYEAQDLDPSRLAPIRDRLQTLIQQEKLDQELKTTAADPDTFQTLLTCADGYLCELKESQIRDGLHILGQCPQGRQLRDLVIAIARAPGVGRVGITVAIATDWQLDLNPLTTDFAELLSTADQQRLAIQRSKAGLSAPPCRIVGDAVELLEQQAAVWIDQLLTTHSLPPELKTECPQAYPEFVWIQEALLPNLRRTPEELTALLHGLEGGFIASGPSGAPTRSRPDTLPTGRNFYSVDIRALPTETAWDLGRKSAEALIERYTQEQGEYPKTLGLSVWGTSTMRTGGDDIAQALAMMGVRPVWEGASRRVIDFEVMPLHLLGRPRVDVTLRISGFFRDAFANLIDLFDRAVQAVAALPEAASQNPLAAQVQSDADYWRSLGLEETVAQARAGFRVFGSKPGAYGAGLQGLIEAQNWESEADLAAAYLNWSSYAYGANTLGETQREAFEQRLQNLEIVLHNQDNREHDLLDSDDYYQFQGGMTVAARTLQGQNPQLYFGDHANPANPKIRTVTEELAKVYRSRVINPKWIAGAMRHGYKGAFEMAATVDYLFAYSATTHCVTDYMYEGVTQAYVLDEQVQAFIQAHNPWALRDIAERLLEAHQRQLWKSASPTIVDQLRAITHAAEAIIEGKL